MALRSSTPWLLILLLFGSGCGYVKAGTWNDDPENWSRAFQSAKPPGVQIAHSRYWRSAHWSLEFEYFFEIERNEDFKRRLFAENKLRRVLGDEAAKSKKEIFGDPPAWFAPKDVAEYDIWVSGDESSGNFKVLIDKTSGAIFLDASGQVQGSWARMVWTPSGDLPVLLLSAACSSISATIPATRLR